MTHGNAGNPPFDRLGQVHEHAWTEGLYVVMGCACIKSKDFGLRLAAAPAQGDAWQHRNRNNRPGVAALRAILRQLLGGLASLAPPARTQTTRFMARLETMTHHPALGSLGDKKGGYRSNCSVIAYSTSRLLCLTSIPRALSRPPLISCSSVGHQLTVQLLPPSLVPSSLFIACEFRRSPYFPAFSTFFRARQQHCYRSEQQGCTRQPPLSTKDHQRSESAA